MLTINDLINIPTEKFKSVFESLNSISEGRQITDEEDIELRAQIKAFNNAMNKASKGHLVSPEFLPTIEAFEKAEFSLAKLPDYISSSLTKTYNDFCELKDEELPVGTKATVNLYCNIYNLFTNNVLCNVIRRFKASKTFKNDAKLKSMVEGAESFQCYMAEHSEESIFNLTPVITALNTTTTTISNLNTIFGILAIVLTFIIVAVMFLTIAAACYIGELTRNVNLLTAIVSGKSIEKKPTKKAIIKKSAIDMDEKIPATTKVFLFKPTGVMYSFMDTVVFKNFKIVDKIITAIDNHKAKSKESYDNNEQSLEVVIAGITIALGTPVFLLAIALALPLLLTIMRSAAYYIGHFRLKAHEFFKDQYEWVNINIEELIEKRDDPNTPEIERKRIDAIIAKQKVWSERLLKWSEKMYKTQLEAGNSARSELRVDESKLPQYERESKEEKEINKQNPLPQEQPEDPIETPTPTPQNKPIALF